jgi:hypothetical protein
MQLKGKARTSFSVQPNSGPPRMVHEILSTQSPHHISTVQASAASTPATGGNNSPQRAAGRRSTWRTPTMWFARLPSASAWLTTTS